MDTPLSFDHLTKRIGIYTPGERRFSVQGGCCADQMGLGKVRPWPLCLLHSLRFVVDPV